MAEAGDGRDMPEMMVCVQGCHENRSKQDDIPLTHSFCVQGRLGERREALTLPPTTFTHWDLGR